MNKEDELRKYFEDFFKENPDYSIDKILTIVNASKHKQEKVTFPDYKPSYTPKKRGVDVQAGLQATEEKYQGSNLKDESTKSATPFAMPD